jgi:hypothetical protein
VLPFGNPQSLVFIRLDVGPEFRCGEVWLVGPGKLPLDVFTIPILFGVFDFFGRGKFGRVGCE